MIIVTQNKENIINFDNVNNIYIKKNDGKSECYEIKANQNCGYSIILGTYSSLDRAKEILEELVKFYRLDDKKEAVPSLDVLASIKIREHGTVYMPEE